MRKGLSLGLNYIKNNHKSVTYDLGLRDGHELRLRNTSRNKKNPNNVSRCCLN